MILGIIASEDTDSSAFTSTSSVLDFVAGSYTHFGATIAPADFLSDAGRIVESGLAIVKGDFDGLEFIGGIAGRIVAAEFTILIDFVADGGLDPDAGQFTFINALNADLTNELLAVVASAFYLEAFDAHTLFDANPFAERDIFEDVQSAVGVPHRIAYTRTPPHAAISVDGRAVISDDTAVAGLVLDRVFCAYADGFAGESGTLGYITRIAIIPPADDADLPTLSTL